MSNKCCSSFRPAASTGHLCLAAAKQKTALNLATVLAANLAFRLRSNAMQSSEPIRSFDGLVPGAMDRVGKQYR